MKAKNPSQQQLNNLLEHYQNRRFSEAEKLAMHITKAFPKHKFAWQVLGAVLGTTGRKSEAVVANQRSVLLSPQDAVSHSNLGKSLQELGRLEEALVSYTQAITLKPELAEAQYNMGVLLQELGRLEDALASYTQAITLKPEFAGAHSNLGVLLQELGRLEEAEVSSRQAIALKPDLAEAHSNLGVSLQGLGRLEEAEVSSRQAIALKPDLAEAHNNLGKTLQDLGRLQEALVSYVRAIELKPDYDKALVNLGIAIEKITFNSTSPNLYPLLTRLLTTGNFTRPSNVAVSILSLLKHDTQIKDLLIDENFAVSLNEATSIIKTLYNIPLLHHLMRVCPLPELQFEALFVSIRSFLLKNLDNMDVSRELIYFLSTLSLHCFTNEYVYFESDEETNLIGELQSEISQTLSQSKQPKVIKVLCLASYRFIHKYDWCQKLDCLDDLEEVKKRLIEEPLLEKMIAKDIPVLGKISNNVSIKVREQYEENPYPRWVKLGVHTKPKPIAAVFDELKLQLHSENIKNVSAPSILIAGCGTGQHSLGTASKFSSINKSLI